MTVESKYPPRRYLAAEERKREIIDVAAPLFFQKGYEATEMAEVAQQAGVSRALLHRHFGGKRELLIAVVREVGGFEPKLGSADSTLSLEERIAINTDVWLDHFESNRNALAIAFLPVSNDPDIAEVVNEVRERIIGRSIEAYLGSPDVPESIRVMMRGFAGLVLTACHEWLWQERATREQVKILMTTCLVGLIETTVPALLAAE